MESLPDVVHLQVYEFLSDKDLIFLYCTNHQLFDSLPHHISCLRVLQKPLEYRKNVLCFLSAMDAMSHCLCSYKCTLELDGMNRIKTKQGGEEFLQVTENCIKRILNRFLTKKPFLTQGEISSHLTFGRAAIFVLEPRFYQTSKRVQDDFVSKFHDKRANKISASSMLQYTSLKSRQEPFRITW